MSTADAAAGAQPEPRKPVKAPDSPLRAYTREDLALVYLRQARTAVVTLVVISVAGVIGGLILAIVIAVGIAHENSVLNGGGGVSNCLSQGGTNPNC